MKFKTIMICVAFQCLFLGCGSELRNNESMAEKYPGPWIASGDYNIQKTMIKANAINCSEYYFKESASSGRGEVLVYGTSDNGRTWTCYLLWPKINESMGPLRPDPSITPPFPAPPAPAKKKSPKTVKK